MLDTLLELQDRDIAIDRLRHRRDTLPERAARDGIATTIDVSLLEDYEACRARARGMGAARLNGNTCQGCHLSIPSVEAERIRKSPPGTVAHCDNCGCI